MIRRFFIRVLSYFLQLLQPKPLAGTPDEPKSADPAANQGPAQRYPFEAGQLPMDCCLVLSLDPHQPVSSTYLIPYDPYAPLRTEMFLREKGVGCKVLVMESRGNPVRFRPLIQPESTSPTLFQFPFHFISVN